MPRLYTTQQGLLVTFWGKLKEESQHIASFLGIYYNRIIKKLIRMQIKGLYGLSLHRYLPYTSQVQELREWSM